ncbi:hypothetical protein KBX50_04635 [Micromonospora sp. C51]|uniref:hypothetical protein n=1 Tax=Micromonospora sp. C51 TaxID=2824879 RepID=UPI001B360066|nr:hypothetical protein [Micromonospora sp. C51]MBQ1047775.1 hypothetical protein [Micromonospora sp. C51]
MRVNKSEMIEGLPAVAARDLMRAYRDHTGAWQAAEILHASEADATAHLARLCAAGYLDSSEHSGGETRWITTVRGNALAQASFRKPISRATAEKRLASTIERVQEYNCDPRKLLTVTRLVVFGSYLDVEKEQLGDLDLAIEAVRRVGSDEWVQRSLEYAASSGRKFGRFIDEIGWPGRELRMLLKGGSAMVNITNEDVKLLTDRYRLVYDVRDDARAVQPSPDAMVHPF